ncbi:MAG TPA: hypothetical protein VHG93_14660, partial [Longimicrobium sp.]|nr:hypothetical protein [Longimicrobium sp.]
GVQVRLLLDAFGAHKMPKDDVRDLEGAGAVVKFFNPIAPGWLTGASFEMTAVASDFHSFIRQGARSAD